MRERLISVNPLIPLFGFNSRSREGATRYGKASFLVIDEIGRTESGATATVEKHCLYRIINERYNNRLPAVLISNLSQKDFIAYLGQASVDRLTESADFCIFDWESYRAQKGGVF